MARNTQPSATLEAAVGANETVQKLIDLGAAQAVVKELPASRHAAIVVPEGYDARLIERHDGAPDVKRGSAIFAEESSFTDYVKAHQTPETHLFYDGIRCTLTCVFDHHAKAADGGQAGGGLFRAECRMPFDEDWQAWNAINDKLLSQIEFVYFLEEHLKNVVEPDGALLMELLGTLEATSAGRASTFHRMQDGSRRVEFSENIEAKVGGAGGRADVPKELRLKLPVFRWSGLWDLTAKLRIRLIEGNLKLGLHLERPQDVVEEAFKRVREAIQTETGLRPHNGTPPSAAELAPRVVLTDG